MDINGGRLDRLDSRNLIAGGQRILERRCVLTQPIGEMPNIIGFGKWISVVGDSIVET
jgi:hypothetical protein